MSTARQRRLWMVLGIVGGIGAATALALRAVDSGIGFRSPTQVLEQQVPAGKRIQLGGMVLPGSVQRTPGSLEVRFVISDYTSQIPVRYEKVLPDLFKENSGAVVNGQLDPQGVFVADEVIAKHDEKYMPPAVEKALQKGQSRLDSQVTPAQP